MKHKERGAGAWKHFHLASVCYRRFNRTEACDPQRYLWEFYGQSFGPGYFVGHPQGCYLVEDDLIIQIIWADNP